ncbi:MAG: UvrD-helicase domain-containing protein [Flavobacteriales bacterium]|nr:UvrD-helicase domain-containing protein [Flavobacteriales bacterium]
MSVLHIYRASAGSGKTFTLTRRYLEKALENPAEFSAIAALTFTNKATAEMKARIFSTLIKLASGEPTEHSEYLLQKVAESPTDLIFRSDMLLRHILKDYRDFTVTTLDKFFQRILRSFAREINVDTGFEPELDYERVMDEIVLQLTEELKPGMPLTEWITEYLTDKIEEGKSRDFRSVIKGLGMKIFDESFRAIAHELEAVDDTYATVGAFKADLRGRRTELENSLSEIGNRALSLMEQHNLLPEDFKGGSKSPFKNFQIWADGVLKEPTNTFLNLLDNEENWVTKTSNRKTEISAVFASGLNECVREICIFFEEKAGLYYSLQAAERNLFVFGIFSELIKKLEAYREENNVLMLADAVDLLRNLTGMDDATFVYEKTGSRYNTYLLDEFQDTSAFQWDCTAPLIHNSLSEGHDNLMVGDPKQSIYRWRGGDRELINSKVPAKFPSHEIHTLNTNWRSRREIIRFNNTVFSLLLSEVEKHITAEFQSNPEVMHSLDLLTKTYQDVTQKWSGKKDGGYVHMRFLAKPTGDEELEEEPDVETEVVALVKSLQDRGFRARDIAILVRKNAEAKQAADILHEARRAEPDSPYVFDVISDEASYLSNSSVLNFLIGLGKFLVNPEDAVNNAGVILEYNTLFPSQIRFEDLLMEGFSGNRLRMLLPKAFAEQESGLSRMAPGPLFDSLLKIFELDTRESEFSYMAAFRDLVTDYSYRYEADLAGFLNYWEEKGSRQSVKAPEEADAIRIMTFHKCKGLEFEAVIIPFFNEATDHKAFHEVPLWVKSSEAPFNQLPYIPVTYGKKLADTAFAAEYIQERMEAISDALNLTYVAFTRAKSEMHILGIKPDESSNVSHFSNLSYLLYQTAVMRPEISQGEDFTNIYFEDESGISLKSGAPVQFIPEDKSEDKSIEKINLPHYYITHPGNRLKLRVSENVAHYSDERRKGIAMHEILSRLKHAEELETLIQGLTHGGVLPESDSRDLLESMQKLLQDETVQKLFSPKAIIKTEAALITPGVSLKIPDRMALLNEEVIVGDFKTGKEDTKHVLQIKDYMQVLHAMGYKNITGVLLYTATGKTEKYTL